MTRKVRPHTSDEFQGFADLHLLSHVRDFVIIRDSINRRDLELAETKPADENTADRNYNRQ